MKHLKKQKIYSVKIFLAIILIIAGIFFWKNSKDQNEWWKIGTDGETFKFLIKNNTIYFSNNLGVLYSVNKTTGTILWQYKTDHSIFSYPVVYKKTVIVTSEDGILYGISTENGTERWRFGSPSKYLFKNPVLIKAAVYVSDTYGTLYAVNAASGKLLWTYKTKPYRGITTNTNTDTVKLFNSLTASGSILFYSGLDGVLYAVNSKSGTTLWIYDIGSALRVQPVINKKTIYVSADKGKTVALNKMTGERIWEKHDEDAAITCFSLINLQNVLRESINVYPKKYLQTILFILQHRTSQLALEITNRGTVALINPQNGQTVWDTKRNFGENISCPATFGSRAYFGSKNEVFAIDIFKGYKIWSYAQKESYFAIPNVYSNKPIFPIRTSISSALQFVFKPISIFVADNTGKLFALNSEGKSLWTFSAFGPINQNFYLHNKFIYFSSTDGSFYRLKRKSGNPPIPKQKFSLQQNIQKVGDNNILEISINFNDKMYDNPWKDVVVTAQFTQNSHESYTIHGFYYDKNTWKIRFNPPLKGQWDWKILFDAPGNKKILTGSFESTTDTQSAFLKIYENNPKRFTLDNKTIFNGIGIGDAIYDRNRNGYPLDDWFIGDKIAQNTTSASISSTVNLDTYLHTYGAEGHFNMYRWSVNNASFNLWNTFTINNKYLITEGKYGDELLVALKQHGFQIWMTIFGFQIPFTFQYPNELREMRHYIQYIVGRYGSYVSIWEISNEAYAPESLVRFIADEIRKADIEKRPISVSQILPDMKEISVIAPHWYDTENIQNSDIDTVQKISKYSSYPKPVVFAEQGNFIPDKTLQSAVRMRVRAWTAFFNEAILIFWNQSNNRDITTSPYANANQFIGELERQHISALQSFTKDTNLSVEIIPMYQTNPAVRGYGLKSEAEILGYFYHYRDQYSKTSFSTTIDIPRNAALSWYDPETGKTLSQQRTRAGRTTLTAPAFAVDLALKIIYN